METQSGSQVIGTAVLVYGQVRVESTDGVSRIIQPNNFIKLDDRIDTGQDGSVSIVLNDDSNSQLDLGQMTQMVIDQDVFGGSEIDELSDVAVEPGLAQEVLQNWDAFEPVTAFETGSALVGETAAVDNLDSEPVQIMDASPKIEAGKGGDTELAAGEVGDDGIGSMDDDLDLSNLIPPPDDAA